MSDNKYTISISNANSTIEHILDIAVSKSRKIKKSSVKESISSLLGFETSNAMDEAIKKHKNAQLVQSIYNRNGQHKNYPSILKKTDKNAIDLYNFFANHKRKYECIISFMWEYTSAEGYQYDYPDRLFCESLDDALEILFDWKKNAKVEYHYFEEGSVSQKWGHGYPGYWYLTIEGDNLDDELNAIISPNTLHLDDPINNPSADRKKVMELLLPEIFVPCEMPVKMDMCNDPSLEEYFIDGIREDYANEQQCQCIEKYRLVIEKYLPYLGIDYITACEAGLAPLEYFKMLKNYGANFKDPQILISAARNGSLETCQYLVECGNNIEVFYQMNDCTMHPCPYLHYEVSCTKSDKLKDREKFFYTVASNLGVNLDFQDQNGETILHRAAGCNNEALYNHLVALGVNQKYKNSEGKTAPELLEESQKQGVEDLLLTAIGPLLYVPFEENES